MTHTPGPWRVDVPYALFRNHGRTIALTYDDYQRAKVIARMCGCGDCDNCRAVAYVYEVLNGKADEVTS